MSKLGIYLVAIDRERHTPARPTRTALVIAESANQAADFATVRGGELVATIEEEAGVGRIGDYDPGITGHRMVNELSLGAIIGEFPR